MEVREVDDAHAVELGSEAWQRDATFNEADPAALEPPPGSACAGSCGEGRGSSRDVSPPAHRDAFVTKPGATCAALADRVSPRRGLGGPR
jgi:hypothetical protein